MKTKEDILSKHSGIKIKYLIHCDINGEIALDAMQEYADQQTEQLKKELEEKDKEIERLNFEYGNMDYLSLDAKCRSLESKLSEKDKELSELKAKHNCKLPLLNVGDLITLNTGYPCVVRHTKKANARSSTFVFLPTLKANAKKPKELALSKPTTRQ